MKLFQKFMAVIKEELNYYGMNNFGSLDDQEIIALDLNLKAKLIRQVPHTIKESKEVLATLSSLGANHKVAYEEIRLRLTNGDDVNPFLSKQAQDPEHQDYLLLDWNIHHFHLNSHNSNGYFNDRSDYLLMVLFKNGVAHFIDIEHHNDKEVFVKREYLEIIKNNWPDAIEEYVLKGALDVAVNYSNEDIKKLRKNQINACLKIGDKVYGPIGGGITTAGAGTANILLAMKWKKYFDSIEKRYQLDETRILEDIFNKTGKKFSELDLDFDYFNNHLVLIDKNSNLIVETMIA